MQLLFKRGVRMCVSERHKYHRSVIAVSATHVGKALVGRRGQKMGVCQSAPVRPNVVGRGSKVKVCERDIGIIITRWETAA